jgi:charged multivesicular body protein 2A
MAAMNRGLNLPQIQRIMNEFEKENSMKDMKEEMMSDAVDDVMDDEAEDEEEEGDKILKEVLDEIGVSLSQQVRQLASIKLCQCLTFLVRSSPMLPLDLRCCLL